jgi:hypothetical protein
VTQFGQRKITIKITLTTKNASPHVGCTSEVYTQEMKSSNITTFSEFNSSIIIYITPNYFLFVVFFASQLGLPSELSLDFFQKSLQ